MTPEDLTRLTEEEKAPLVRGQYPGDVEFLLTRLALARAVVEAARDDAGQHVTWCQCPLCRALAAHDAEVGR